MIVTRLRALWRWWTRVAHAIGTFQARVLLTVLYVVLLPPFALIARRSDPLQRRAGGPGWIARPVKVIGVDEARRQF